MMKRITGEEMAQQFSAFVNVAHDKEGFATTVANEHRFLQHEMFDCMLACIENWSKAYDNKHFDARNQYACKASKIMFEALKKENMY